MSAVAWHSQSDEDQLLFYSYFYNVRHGFYLEMGALDGHVMSNTKFFADSLGWRGLLIEPSPTSFSRLMANRPNDLCVRAAICSSSTTVHYVTNTGPVDGIVEFMSPGFKSQWHSDIVAAQTRGEVIPMPCLPLQTLLDMYSVTTVDFWSLDVEGAELEVLRTVNFSAVHFSVILIETDGSNLDKEVSIRSLLTSHDFTSMGLLNRSEWFLHRDFQPHARPHIFPPSPMAPNYDVPLPDEEDSLPR